MTPDIGRFRPTVPSMFGSTVLIALLALTVITTTGADRNALKDDEREIKATVIRAYELTHGSATALPPPFLTDMTARVPDDVWVKMREDVLSSAQEVYSASSPLLSLRVEQLQGVVDSQAEAQVSVKGRKDFCDLGGGIRSIENLDIQVDGDSAVVEADITPSLLHTSAAGRGVQLRCCLRVRRQVVYEQSTESPPQPRLQRLPGCRLHELREPVHS